MNGEYLMAQGEKAILFGELSRMVLEIIAANQSGSTPIHPANALGFILGGHNPATIAAIAAKASQEYGTVETDLGILSDAGIVTSTTSSTGVTKYGPTAIAIGE